VNDSVPALVDLRAAGRILGPRWSFAVEGAVGSPWEQLTSYSYALEAAQRHKALGVDVLKEYNTPLRQQRQWLAAAAHETGLGIVSHLQTFEGTMTRVVDGYTGGDHPYMPAPFYKDVHELLRQTGYIWTPNVVITPGTVGSGENSHSYFCQAVFAKQAREGPVIDSDHAICSSDQATPGIPFEVHRLGRVARQAAQAARGGVRIGVSAHNMPGSGVHREMWFLWKGGLSIGAVLRAATMGNARKLGLQEEVGSLEPGKLADFLVLDHNPLEDILNTLSLKYTVQGGVVYDSDTAQRAERE
jgi:hypothetical protein